MSTSSKPKSAGIFDDVLPLPLTTGVDEEDMLAVPSGNQVPLILKKESVPARFILRIFWQIQVLSEDQRLGRWLQCTQGERYVHQQDLGDNDISVEYVYCVCD